MSWFLLLSSVLLYSTTIVNCQLLNASYCYGDNSGGNNLVAVFCSPNVVHVVDIITGTKPTSLGCPAEQHSYSENEQGTCCTLDDADCSGTYNGDIGTYTACNGQVSCQGRPIVRTFTDAGCADAAVYPAYTNYMVFQYRCVEPYNLHGSCSTTEQCYDEYAVCDNSLCVCEPGTTERNSKCYKDGTPGGKCNTEISCVGQNITCVHAVCTCDSGFSAVQETCIEDGTLGGKCSETVPCTDDKTVCSAEGLCECVSGYEERNRACFKEDYYLINDTSCYGDSSNGDNLVNVTCDAGVIYVYDIIAGSKPIYLECPEVDHIYSAAEHNTCCTYNAEDCLTPYTGDWTNYLACNGLRGCYGVPIIRIETDPLCNATMNANYKRYSNYMLFQYFCVPDYRLHGACNTTEQCTDENAVCNKNVCLCGQGYAEIDDSCIENGSIGGLCNATIPCSDANAECSVDGLCQCKNGFSKNGDSCTEDGKPGGKCIEGTCTDVNAECSEDGMCECLADYSEINATCIADGSVGGKCGINTMCDGNFTVCNNNTSLDCGRLTCSPGVCFCIDGYSANSDGVCVKDGSVGGKCSDTIICTDGNAVCSSDGVCECEVDHTAIEGACIKDGVIGGFCNDTLACVDENSTCSNNNICECDTGYSVRNYVCIPDGTVGGQCESGTCSQANTECSSNGTCVCIPTFFEVNRICKKDGDVLGKCNLDGSCDDVNAECDKNSGLECGVYACDPGVCTCVDNYSPNSEGVCVKDGVVGGYCNATLACEDRNSTCSNNNICKCDTGYSVRNYVCIPVGTVGGQCESGTCSQANTECSSNGTCVCIPTFFEVNRICKKDGDVLGKCNLDGSCDDVNAECDKNSGLECGVYACDPGVCTCVDNYSPNSEGVCVKDGVVGGYCNATLACEDRNSTCSNNNICKCDTGYSVRNYVCIPDGTVGGQCESGTCSQANTECSSNGTCVCIPTFFEVNRICKKDGDVLGKCNLDGSCDDVNAECDENSGLECGVYACDPGVCTCVDNYSPNSEGVCVKDGSLGGKCSDQIPCKDTNAVCSATGECECRSGYTEYYGECVADGEIGGACVVDADCLDANAVCSNDSICVCDTGYSEVDRECHEVGTIGGVCDENSSCSESFTTCNTSTGAMCGATTCSPGVCACFTGYSVVDASGECTKDGDLGGKCESDSDCNDGNAVCDSQTKVCQCPTGYTDMDGVCIQDGSPDGVCLGAGDTCLDSHSVCDAGVCRCNVYTDYSNQDGTCVRDDGYIHGECQSATDCVDDNAQCSLEGVCECKAGYGEVNGECKKGETPSVTACEGDDPYNSLQPDCPPGSHALILREVTMVKPASSQCPGVLEPYNGATYAACCTPGEGDCEVVTDIATDCDPNVTYLADTNYCKLEYVCTGQNDSVAVDDDDVGSGRPVILTSPNFPGNDASSQSEQSCSVQASCQSDIDVYLLLNEMAEDVSGCHQYLEIAEGSGTTKFTCSDTAGATPIHASSGGYFTTKLVNSDPSKRGKFVLKFEAQISTADVTLSCGSHFDNTPGDIGPCALVAGALGGPCSATFPCTVPNSVCTDNVCQCVSGYEESEDACSFTGGDEGPGLPIGVIIGAALGGLLLLLALLLFLCRGKIRKKLCPKEKEPLESIVPITHAPVGPAPMNTKFPGRPDPMQVKKKKTLPPLTSHPNQPFVDYLMDEQGDDIKMRNTLNGAFPGMRPGEDSVVRTKFSRSVSSAHLIGAPNGFAPPIRPRPPPETPSHADKPEKNENDKKEKKKKKRRMKALQKARVGITASRAFEQPFHGHEGVYRRLPEGGAHPPPAPPTARNALPSFPPNVGNSSHPPPVLHPNTPLSRSFGERMANAHLPPHIQSPGQVPAFNLRSQWQRAGMVATVPSFMRRGSTLDITTVNEPDTLETTELD